MKQSIDIKITGITLEGILRLPKTPEGLVLFSHGSGSGRLSPRNNFVAEALGENSLASLLLDLLTEEEDKNYQNRFDINLLTDRLVAAANWAKAEGGISHLPLGLFGASSGAASALRCAAAMPKQILAVVSRGGRPDLAMGVLAKVSAPTLLIVGGNDEQVLELNRAAYKKLRSIKKLAIVPGATHLFEEPGTLEQATEHAVEWFVKYLPEKSNKR